MKPLTAREANHQAFGNKGSGERMGLTRHVGGRARFSYEMRTAFAGKPVEAADGLLQGADGLDSLLKYLDEKRNVVVVRTSDGVVVARSPELNS